MRILVTGSSGFIGSALVASLLAAGHQVSRLVRPGGAREASDVGWDPSAGILDAASLAGLDGVVHLAGESVATGRWTAAKKTRILNSRVQGTHLLCETLAGLAQPPSVVLSASAIGYYGDRADELLSEESPSGSGFLAEVCREWEAATAPASQRGIRVAHLRIGIVLGRAGGALAKLLPPFRVGIGGVLGGGQQYMSWVSLDDLLGAIGHLLETDSLRGPMNLVAPNPVTNREFTRVLGRVLRRPTVCPVPAVILRGLLGEFADAALLASTRVIPSQLSQSRYAFRYPELEGALRHALSSPSNDPSSSVRLAP